MIILTIRVNIHSEKRQEFIQTVVGLTAEIRNMSECLKYEIYQAIEQDDLFYLASNWKSRYGLEEYFQTRYFGVLLGAMQVLGKSPEIQVNTISHTAGAEAIQAVRGKPTCFQKDMILRGEKERRSPLFLQEQQC